MTSSASATTCAGISILRAFAVLRLMTNSNFVDCTTGKLAGSQAEIFGLLLLESTNCNSEIIPEFKKSGAWRAFGRQQPRYMKRTDWLAGVAVRTAPCSARFPGNRECYREFSLKLNFGQPETQDVGV